MRVDAVNGAGQEDEGVGLSGVAPERDPRRVLPLRVETAIDGLYLLAWAKRMIEEGGFAIVGLDADAVRVVPAVAGAADRAAGRAGVNGLTETGPIGSLEPDPDAVREAAAVHGLGTGVGVGAGVGAGVGGKAAGYTGQVCASCGSSRVSASGTCGKCEDCGSTGGCS